MNRSHELVWLRDPRLAAHVTSALPAWLWSEDGRQILWCNAAGAAVFAASSPANMRERAFGPQEPASEQVRSLAAALSPGAAPRLERLRGFVPGDDRPLACLCARMTLADGRAGILVAATEPIGPALSLGERVRSMFADEGEAAAIFSKDGELIHATADAALRLGGGASLAALGTDALREQALVAGSARGMAGDVAMTLERIGSDDDIVVLATFDSPMAAKATSIPVSEPAPLLSIVTSATNVVPFRPSAGAPNEKRPILTAVEQTPFQDAAMALAGRADVTDGVTPEKGARPVNPLATATHGASTAMPVPTPARAARQFPRPRVIPSAYAPDPGASARSGKSEERTVLDRLPSAALVYRDDVLLYANRTFFEWTGYEDLAALQSAGGLAHVFAEPGIVSIAQSGSGAQRLVAITRRGEGVRVEARLFSIQWEGKSAFLVAMADAEWAERARKGEETISTLQDRSRAAEVAERFAEERVKAAELSAKASQAAARELQAILDTATDGVAVVDGEGFIITSNSGLETLFGYNTHDLLKRSFLDLFDTKSQSMARDYLQDIAQPSSRRAPGEGCEVTGQAQDGRLVPLLITIGRIAGSADKFCVVLRDVSQWKHTETELTQAKQQAERASSAKSDFLAKVSHEIRTPLNSIIGFSEVMMEQRFGPIENERYRQYLNDIHTSGQHLISLINDLLDLSKIEAGKLDLNFATVNLNEAIQQCVAMMQPETSRARVLVRTSLAPTLAPILADERSIRQIVLNLLSNSIKFTAAGGQVIVSTARSEQGEVVLRVRDTGVGMTEKELATALEPFRQVTTSGRAGAGGTGLGLPLTKALAEANRARFSIKSAVEAGTLVEIVFPAGRPTVQ